MLSHSFLSVLLTIKLPRKFRVDFRTKIWCATNTLGGIIFCYTVSTTTRYGGNYLLE